jgi:5-formyltetrahydrofolate cyclo-ligase
MMMWFVVPLLLFVVAIVVVVGGWFWDFWQELRQEKVYREKLRLRKFFRDKVSAMTEDHKCAQRLNLYRGFWKEPCYESAQTIGFYIGNDQEIGTRPLINQALTDGKRCYVPYTEHGRSSKMVFIRLERYDQMDDWTPTPWGSKEPDYLTDDLEVAIGRLDLLIVPGIAFDRHGYRLGYGWGHYNRYITDFHPKYTVALAFDQQVLKTKDLPRDENEDRRMKLVLWSSCVPSSSS